MLRITEGRPFSAPVGRTLVLVDIGAGLAVDLLPDALPEVETE